MKPESPILIAKYEGTDLYLWLADPSRSVTKIPGFVNIYNKDGKLVFGAKRIESYLADAGLARIKVSNITALSQMKGPSTIQYLTDGKVVRLGASTSPADISADASDTGGNKSTVYSASAISTNQMLMIAAGIAVIAFLYFKYLR